MKRSVIFIIYFLISALYIKSFAQCNSYLNVYGSRFTGSMVPSGASLGDIDVTGNQVTVEAMFSCTDAQYYNQYFSENQGGDLVAKHYNALDANYILRPTWAAITTTNGFYQVSSPYCTFQINKTNHAAMVYNGTRLSLYINGYLVGSTSATGDLVTNDWPTCSGNSGNYTSTIHNDFLGYVNEVRVWNIARSQTDLNTYMNTALPNPTTQTGLLANYNFGSLTNLQGNSAYDAVLFGDAAIAQTNPTCSNFIADNCGYVPPPPPDPATQVPCASYLYTTAAKTGVTIGDLDVTGSHITVEAIYRLSQTYTNTSGGDIVSKHASPSDCNYVLRPDMAGIRAGNRFYYVTAPCPASTALVRQPTHTALTYDGVWLIFYRDGIELGRTQASGNLYTNNWPTRIGTQGYLASTTVEDFYGTINEVRIWNVARSQSDIQNNMNIMLANPTTQTGLLAYYTFNSLNNKQGNSAWNGVITGSAQINQTLDPSSPSFCPVLYFSSDGCVYTRNSNKDKNVFAKDSQVLQGDNEFSVFPNPIHNTASMSIATKESQNATIKLVSASGAVIIVQPVKLLVGTNNVLLQIKPSTAPGLYMVQVELRDKTISKKVIIQ